MVSVQESLAIIKRGCEELIVEAGNGRQARDRPTAARQGRLRPDRARPAPGPHGADQQDAPVPGSRPSGDLPDRRLHRHDRRSDRQERDHGRRCPASRSQTTRRTYKDQVFKILDPEKTEVAFNSTWFDRDGCSRPDPARRQAHGGAHARARRLRQALPKQPADRHPRVPLSPGPGLRLGGVARGHRAGRHRPEVQPAGRARAAEALRPAVRSAF